MINFQVGIIGREKIDKDDPVQIFALEEAYKLGRILAKEGYVIITGGLGGIMESVSKGASEGGGVSIGIIPYLSEDEQKIRKINTYQTCRVITGMDQRMRIPLLVNSCNALIVISGGMGTWLEACFGLANNIPILTLQNTGRMATKLTKDDNFSNSIVKCNSIDDLIVVLNEIRGNINCTKESI
jgi:uncharacterized protein (TIGR00725 family)